jgi:hypothetical protein
MSNDHSIGKGGGSLIWTAVVTNLPHISTRGKAVFPGLPVFAGCHDEPSADSNRERRCQGGGRPSLRGMRIQVTDILELLAASSPKTSAARRGVKLDL